MAKITLENGMVIEGTVEEFKQMGVKFPVEESEPEPSIEAKLKIDRKPNEFKEGDVVRYIGGASTKGRIVTIEGIGTAGRFRIHWGKEHGYSHEPSENLELITPVEARFDRANA